jgi:hypothetical protein
MREIAQYGPIDSIKLHAIGMPSIIDASGENARRQFIEFFAVSIRNPNTRKAYYRAVVNFLNWCGDRGIKFEQIGPLVVAAYIEQHTASTPTVKQHLAAIRMFFNWLVVGHVIPVNPALSVRGPKYVLKRGKTPILTKDETRALLENIDISSVVGLRDRALIATMVYSFARVGAVKMENAGGCVCMKKVVNSTKCLLIINWKNILILILISRISGKIGKGLCLEHFLVSLASLQIITWLQQMYIV